MQGTPYFPVLSCAKPCPVPPKNQQSRAERGQEGIPKTTPDTLSCALSKLQPWKRGVPDSPVPFPLLPSPFSLESPGDSVTECPQDSVHGRWRVSEGKGKLVFGTRVTIAQRKGGHTHVHTGWGHGCSPKNLVSVATFPHTHRSDIHTKGRDLWPPGCQSQGVPGCLVPITDDPNPVNSSQALLRWGRGGKRPLDTPRRARPPCRYGEPGKSQPPPPDTAHSLTETRLDNV